LDLDLVVVVACGRRELQEASDLDPTVVDARVLSGAAILDLARWISIQRRRTQASTGGGGWRGDDGEFLLHGVPSVVGETAEVLSLGGGLRIDVEAVLNQLPGHSWHVRWLPREDVAVCPEEVDERVFLFGV
jgi:hypothetical protein